MTDRNPCERVEPREPRPGPALETGPSPGDWRCNAPGAVCVDQRACDRAGKCRWESWEAVNPPRPGAV